MSLHNPTHTVKYKRRIKLYHHYLYSIALAVYMCYILGMYLQFAKLPLTFSNRSFRTLSSISFMSAAWRKFLKLLLDQCMPSVQYTLKMTRIERKMVSLATTIYKIYIFADTENQTLFKGKPLC